MRRTRSSLITSLVIATAVFAGWIAGAGCHHSDGPTALVSGDLGISSFTTLGKGLFSGCTTEKDFVITNASDLQSLWTIVFGSGTAPTVDFSANTVFATCRGSEPHGGFDTEIVQVLDQDPTTLSIKDTDPGVRCSTTTAPTQPYHIIKAFRKFTNGTATHAIETKDCS